VAYSLGLLPDDKLRGHPVDGAPGKVAVFDRARTGGYGRSSPREIAGAPDRDTDPPHVPTHVQG
jgi:hypothetical protein